MQKAEQYRREIALAWLGEELPPTSGPTIINVRFEDEANRGLTWAKECYLPSPKRPERKSSSVPAQAAGENVSTR